MNKKDLYKEYCEEIEKYTNAVSLRDSVKTNRRGWAGIRDKLVFYKNAWTMGAQYASLPRELLFWLSLTPLAIANVNEALKTINSPIVIPLSWGSVLACAVISIVIIFGVLSYTRFGLPRRSSELNAKINPWVILLYGKMKDIEEKMEQMDEKE